MMLSLQRHGMETSAPPGPWGRRDVSQVVRPSATETGAERRGGDLGPGLSGCLSLGLTGGHLPRGGRSAAGCHPCPTCNKEELAPALRGRAAGAKSLDLSGAGLPGGVAEERLRKVCGEVVGAEFGESGHAGPRLFCRRTWREEMGRAEGRHEGCNVKEAAKNDQGHVVPARL